MVVVRNVFELKYGKAREATALMKESIAIQKRILSDVDFSTRILTDLTGRFYTLVLEIVVPDLATYEARTPQVFADKEFQEKFHQTFQYIESGRREFYHVVE